MPLKAPKERFSGADSRSPVVISLNGIQVDGLASAANWWEQMTAISRR